MTKRVLRYEMRNGVGSDWYVSYDLLDRACRMLKDTYCRLLLNGYDVIGTNGIMILSKCKKSILFTYVGSTRIFFQLKNGGNGLLVRGMVARVRCLKRMYCAWAPGLVEWRDRILEMICSLDR